MPYKALKSDGKDGRKRKGKRTVKNSSTAPSKLVVTARFRAKAEEAVQYRLMNYSIRQIAAEMKCDPSYVQRLIKWSMERDPVEGAAELRQKMSEQLSMMLTSTLESAFSGDSEAQDQSRKTMDFFAKLNGLYLPTKIEGEVSGGGAAITFVISAADAKV